MHRRALADKSAAKFFENVVNGNQYLVIALDIFLVVRFVFSVLGKRQFRRAFVGNGPDLWLDAELCEICKNAAVKVRYRQAVIQRKLFEPAFRSEERRVGNA